MGKRTGRPTRRQQVAASAFRVSIAHARAELAAAAEHIDAAGLHADIAAGTRDGSGDMLGCYASNGLHGTLALLDKMEAIVTRADRRARQRERRR